MWWLKALQRSLSDVYNWLVPLFVINVLWFVLSLTVIGFPGATAGLFEVARQVEKGYSPAISEYLQAVRRWLVRAWAWGAALLATVGIAVVGVPFYAGQQGLLWTVLLFLSVAIVFVLVAALFYFWPYMLIMETPRVYYAFRNALYTVLAAPLYALLYVGLSIVLLVSFGGLSLLLLAVIAAVILAFLSTYSLRAWLVHKGLLPADSNPAE